MEIIKEFPLSARSQSGQFAQIIGDSAALASVLSGVQCVAPTDSTVLVQGETGTGKELIARAIHNISGRRGRPFVTLNCAAIPLDLLESELFGHERGAFTGAIAQKIGRFEMADAGTLFLDEVGDLPLALQPKLLRVLQEREFERLGSCRTHRIDVRLVVATHRNLTEMVARHEFRSDLYYRLNVFPVVLPPLRDRSEDIEPLIRHFVQFFSNKMGKTIHLITEETLEAFKAHSWPGNVRELQNLIERAVILSSEGVLSSPFSKQDSLTVAVASTCGTFQDSQRSLIVRALQGAGWRVGGHQGAAARLGLKRTTLIAKMKKLGISRSTEQIDMQPLAESRKSPSMWPSVAESGDGAFPPGATAGKIAVFPSQRFDRRQGGVLEPASVADLRTPRGRINASVASL